MPESDRPAGLSLQEAFAVACKLSGPMEVEATHRRTGSLQSFAIPQPFALIGRAQPMGIRLEDPSVSQCHAYLQVIEGVPFCSDLGSRMGVAWSDGSRGKGWVYPNHTLQIGEFDLRVRHPSVDPQPGSDDPLDSEHSRTELLPPVSLAVHPAGGGPAGQHPLERPITLVGRHPACHVRLLDDAVSYFHCSLVNTPDGVWCIDFLSRKGTLLQGRATRLARLRDGDLIEIGRVSVVVRFGSASEELNGGAILLHNSQPGAGIAGLAPKPPDATIDTIRPICEVVERFEHCFATMAQMFAKMQQDQASLMCEQMRLLQEMTRELREFRSQPQKEPTAPPAQPQPGQSPAAPPTASPPAAPAMPFAFDELRDLIGGLGASPPSPSTASRK